MKNTALPAILIFLSVSCNRLPEDVRIILNAAGENRPELEKVIDHYKASGDKEKLLASYFLIGNMDNKFTIESKEIIKYDPIFNIIDSLNKIGIVPIGKSAYLKSIWDSLVAVKGTPSLNDSEIIPDYKVIKADLLIENIDIAFKLRNESQWGKKISFDKFCEFVLAYRFSHEPIERWRNYYFERYKNKLDSINTGSCYELAITMHRIIPQAVWYMIFYDYPFDIPNSKMVKEPVGACNHIVIYNATALRGIGLPVGIDYTPLWGNYHMGHRWNVLFQENDKPLHFDRTENDPLLFDRKKDTLDLRLVWKPAKIFRETFGRQRINNTDAKKDVPENFLDNHRIDVTHEYTTTYNINVPVRYESKSKKKYAVICTFDDKSWVPQDYGRIKRGKASFKNMGSGVLYLTMYYDKGELSPASDPFVLDENGRINSLVSDKGKTQVMLLLRKFHPPKVRFPECYNHMINGYFQGANKADFSDSVKLFTITALPEKIETVEINNPLKFRYVRYKSPPPGRGNVAELEFYGGKKSSDTLLLYGKVIGYPEVPPSIGTPYSNAFDGNLETYFDRYTPGSSWVGLDLGSPKRITKIRYCPRSDTNFILVGETYELCYWENGGWVSMGTQVAKDQFLIYNNVPSGGLYILHNLTRGKEERIFTYEKGKQVFW